MRDEADLMLQSVPVVKTELSTYMDFYPANLAVIAGKPSAPGRSPGAVGVVKE